MPCDRQNTVRHLAVESPEVLRGEPWAGHLQNCGECRAERMAFEGSLAVFRQIEGERLQYDDLGPDWEEFSRVLAHSKGPFSRRGWLRPSMIGAAAAAAVAIMVTGILMWPASNSEEPALPNLITISPEQQLKIEQTQRLRFVGGGNLRSRPGNSTHSVQVPIQVFTFPDRRTPSRPSVRQSPVFTLPASNPPPVQLFRSLKQKRTLVIRKLPRRPLLSPISSAAPSGQPGGEDPAAEPATPPSGSPSN